MFARLFDIDQEQTIPVSLGELEDSARNNEQSTDEDNPEEPGAIGGFHKHWGWISLINDMAIGRMDKWDYYFDLSVIEFLNKVCFFKDKREYENSIAEKNQRDNGND